MCTKDSVIEVISAAFSLFFPELFKESKKSFLFFCLSHQHKQRHTKKRDTLKCRCSKWRGADWPLRHYPFLCLLSILRSHSASFPSVLFVPLALAASVRCVHLFPFLIVLSLVILSSTPHLSAIIKDPVASYIAPVERRVCISATHLATAPRNYGL